MARAKHQRGAYAYGAYCLLERHWARRSWARAERFLDNRQPGRDKECSALPSPLCNNGKEGKLVWGC